MKRIIVLIFLSISCSANAGLLYSSGSATIDSPICDAENCSGSSEWWVIDDFTNSLNWNITGLEFFSNLNFGSLLDYMSTSWEIVSSSDPYGAALFSGTGVATITGNSYLLSGLDINLSSGTYFLSHHHDFSTEVTTTAMLTGDQGSFYQTDKSNYQFTYDGEVAINIYGKEVSVPEPSPLVLLGLGIAAFGMSRKMKRR